MSKIHPADNKSHRQKKNTSIIIGVTLADDQDEVDGPPPVPTVPIARPTVLTVWKRSSMSFQGTDGFTVFDHHGDLAFRVDNYSRTSSQHFTSWSCTPAGGVRALVLMDGCGKPLLTLKPQMFSMQHQWNGYRGGEEDNVKSSTVSSTNRVLTMRRPIISTSSVLVLLGSHNKKRGQWKSRCEAEVFVDKNTIGGFGGAATQFHLPDFRIEGSFWRRNCKIKDLITGQVAAKIVRKRATAGSTIMLSDDVFSLVVQPAFDPELIMALVVILDRICLKPFAPLICS